MELRDMKACVLRDIGKIVYEDVPRPVPKEGEVLVHVKACGICGSDIPRVFTKGTYHFPTIPGHEFSGVIEALGDSVDSEWLHKRVAVFPLLPCRSCPACERGSYAQCENYDYLGSRSDGAFSEYVTCPVWNLILLPDNVPFDVGAMLEPAAVAYHAATRAGLAPGENALVVGAGTIGLITALWLRFSGADTVVLCDVDASHLSFAEGLGFPALNSTDPEFSNKLDKLSGGRGIACAFDCVGIAPALETCLSNVRTGGTVVAVGNPAGDMLLHQAAYWQILRKELRLVGTWNSSYLGKDNDWIKVIRAMESGHLNLARLITHRFALSEHQEAFGILREKKEFSVKVLFVNE